MSSNSAIIKFGYKDYKEYTDPKTGNKKHSAACVFCRGPVPARITETLGTSSGFTRHLSRVHKAKYAEYQKLAKGPGSASGNQSITGFCQPSGGRLSSETQQYRPTHPRQQAITEAIIKFLIIGCSLPLSIVENPNFREFLKVVDPRYTPIARSTLTGKMLPQLYAAGRQKIKDILQHQSSVSITTDIWSDRVMRSFLGVTAHTVIPSKDGSMQLASLLLDCQRFQGSHTGERISAAFEDILDDNGIKNKVDFITTDNASNMKAAFKVRFPSAEDDPDDTPEEDGASSDVDDESLWMELQGEDHEHVEAVIDTSSKQRLSCFAHSLQLVVGDGLKETRGMATAIAKACRMSTLLHRSTIFKERFEQAFGRNRSIPAANSTRWNSTLHQLKSILSLDQRTLGDVCSDGFAEVAYSAREWSQLTELCDVLTPFGEATDLTQGEKMVTISLVVPTVLDLFSHLKKKMDSVRHCRPLVAALVASLQRRFQGIFQNCRMAAREEGVAEEPFADKVYLLSTVLDPQFSLHWVDIDVTGTAGQDGASLKQTREELKRTLQDLVIAEADSGHEASVSTTEALSSEEEEEIPAKVPRLLAKYHRHRNRSGASSRDDSTRGQLAKYFDEVARLDSGTDPLQFWQEMASKLPSLHRLASRVLSVPASSAPVERIFSRGGIIMRPHRSRLSAEMLSTLMFLKCNEAVL